MLPNKAARLEATVAALQKRWGPQSIHLFGDASTALTGIQTGFATLDRLLAPSCIPIGQMTEILGRGTSGMVTLGYQIMACAQEADRFAIYIDLAGTFDAEYAAVVGVDLARVFVVRPETDIRALDIARDALGMGAVRVIVLDLGEVQTNHDRFYRLTSTLIHSRSALIRLESLPLDENHQPIRSSPAALRLLVERVDWQRRGDDITGWRSRVTVLKGRRGMGQTADIAIDLDAFARRSDG